METLTLNIDGMTCGGCVRSLTNALQAVAGVDSANVSLEQHTATISFDPTQTNRAALEVVVDDAGFDVVK